MRASGRETACSTRPGHLDAGRGARLADLEVLDGGEGRGRREAEPRRPRVPQAGSPAGVAAAATAAAVRIDRPLAVRFTWTPATSSAASSTTRTLPSSRPKRTWVKPAPAGDRLRRSLLDAEEVDGDARRVAELDDLEGAHRAVRLDDHPVALAPSRRSRRWRRPSGRTRRRGGARRCRRPGTAGSAWRAGGGSAAGASATAAGRGGCLGHGGSAPVAGAAFARGDAGQDLHADGLALRARPRSGRRRRGR